MFTLYNLLLLLASPFILALLLAKKRCRPGLRQRLGWLPQGRAAEWGDGRTIWLHAVSMGEATAAVPLVQQLKARYPDFRIVVSTVTETGRETIQKKLSGQAQHLYFPLDYPWAVRSVLDAVRPRLIIIVETELWPNFLREAAARGIPVILANGRLATDSFAGYLRLRFFFRRVLAAFTLCSMQTDRDVERIIQLGVAPERVVLYGVATDVCDRYAIDGLLARWPRLPIFAVTDAMKPIHPDAAERLFAAWRTQGVRFVTTDDVLAGRLATTPAESHA